MKIATILLQNAIRLLGVIIIVLGFLFWTRHAYNLVPLHMRLAETLILLLWILAIVGIRAKVSPALTITAIVWGALVVWFGYQMGRFLSGATYEVIRVLHFLIGLTAIGLAEGLGKRIKRTSEASK